MNLDGFKPADTEPFHGYVPDTARTFFRWVDTVGRALHVQVQGIERIPKGRALLVGNHVFGWDAMLPIAAISRELGRPVWVLGEHLWWKVPFLRRLAASVGVVDGTAENADRLLSAEQLVLVLPGGLREAVKPRELRYQLLWGHRYGFVHCALRNQAPLVPLASIGSDDLFDFVGNPYQRGRRWLGRLDFPIPLPARLLPIPHRVSLRFVVGEPIPPTVPAEEAEKMEPVRRLRREVEGALHELIENELARRAGIDLS